MTGHEIFHNGAIMMFDILKLTSMIKIYEIRIYYHNTMEITLRFQHCCKITVLGMQISEDGAFSTCQTNIYTIQDNKQSKSNIQAKKAV